MKVKIFTMLLLLATVAGAQQRKMVRIGGPDEDRAKDWPKVVAKEGRSDGELLVAARAYVGQLVQRDLFSGTVLIARDGQPLLVQSWGLANKDFGVPNTDDTKYNIGSINKVFTQVALQQLRDQGKLDFSKNLRTVLPDYPSDIADRITIAQLLEHSSGLGDIFGPEYAATAKNRIRTLSDYLALFGSKPLEFEPGARRRYSNAGYVVLGLVIDKLSGMSYHDYVRANIFAPLGMNDSGSWDSDAIVPKRAVGYTREDGVLRTNIYTLPGRSSSAGGGYSTAGDLLRFTRDARKVLSAAAFERMIGENPGVGWAGGSPGGNAAIEMNGPYTLIVLSNYDPPAAEEVAQNLRVLLGIAGE